MAKNTSILLGDYFNDFIGKQIKTGRFNTASEVIRAALRLFEQEENKKKALINALKNGEQSGFIEEFDKDMFLNNLRKKYLKHDL